VVYLTSFLGKSDSWPLASNEKMIVSDELERMWKEAIVVECVLSRHLFRGTEKTTKNRIAGLPAEI
jgi:hypothetical protein